MQLSQLFHVKYKRLFFTVNDRFMSKEHNLDADINYFIQCPVNSDNKLNEFYTLLIDLRETKEEIWKKIYHRTRSEINSFINNQTFEQVVLFHLSDRDLTAFIELFDKFAAVRDIRRAEAFRLKAYNDSGILAVSYIKQNGAYLCINFYRLTKQRATNLYSFTLKHSSSSFNNSQYGRAHKALHWMDIVRFKEEGVEHYDFCGWYDGKDDQALLNINKFKEQFTSNKVKEYSGVIYNHWLLKLLKKWR